MSFDIRFTRHAWRMLVEWWDSAMSFKSVHKAEPGQLVIKRHKPGILIIIITHLFTLQAGDFDMT